MDSTDKFGLQCNGMIIKLMQLCENVKSKGPQTKKAWRIHLNLWFSSGRQELLHHAPMVLVSCSVERRGAPGRGGVNIRPVTQQ